MKKNTTTPTPQVPALAGMTPLGFTPPAPSAGTTLDAGKLSSDEHDRVRVSGEELTYRGFSIRNLWRSKLENRDEWTFELTEYDEGDPAGSGRSLAECIEQIDELVEEADVKLGRSIGELEDAANDPVDDGFLDPTPTAAVDVKPKFRLGRTVATRGAAAALETVGQSGGYFFEKHVRLEPGDLPAEDVQTNEDALTNGARIFSAYKLDDGTRIWIITEADRSSTTILLPEEY